MGASNHARYPADLDDPARTAYLNCMRTWICGMDWAEGSGGTGALLLHRSNNQTPWGSWRGVPGVAPDRAAPHIRVLTCRADRHASPVPHASPVAPIELPV